MNYNIETSESFDKEAKRLLKHYASFAGDYNKLLEELSQNPQLGTDLGGGLRKIRMKITSKGKGKSGGARVISFTVILSAQDATLNLLYIYDKSERTSISKKEIEELPQKNGLKWSITGTFSFIFSACHAFLLKKHIS